MKKYSVPITRDCTETTWVLVEAANVNDALVLAHNEVLREPWAFHWVADEGSGSGDPYIADESGESVEEQSCVTGEKPEGA